MYESGRRSTTLLTDSTGDALLEGFGEKMRSTDRQPLRTTIRTGSLSLRSGDGLPTAGRSRRWEEGIQVVMNSRAGRYIGRSAG